MRLELRNVTAAYGQAVALRNVNLVVPERSVVAVLGPNGAGKTTMLGVASGLVSPVSGSVLLDREDATSEAPDRRFRRGACHVTEGRSVFPNLTVRENLRAFAFAGRENEAIERALDAFPRLGGRLGQLAGTMSGGEQQMLALSRAYVSDAPLVMLDEVSMGLAPIIVEEIYGFLRTLVEQGTSLLLVEQYVAKALALADTVYVLSRGRVVFAGEPAELDGSDIFDQYLDTTAAAEEALR